MKDANGYGRDHTLTDEIADSLEHAFKVGATIEDAAHFAGIRKRTLERWLTRGRGGEEPYLALVDRLDVARGMGRVRDLTFLATSPDWKARRALLAMQRKEYAERRFVHGQVDHRHTLDLAGVPTEALERVVEILRGAGVEIEDAEVQELPEAV